MHDTEQAKGHITYDASSAITFTKEAQRALVNASEFTIDSDEMLSAAADDLRAVKSLQKRVEETRTSITGPLNQATRAINDLFRAPANFLDRAEAKLKSSMLAYTTEQERKAQIARRLAEEEARKHREILAEEQRQQEAIAREAYEAAQRAQKEAEAAEEKGNIEAAAAAKELAIKQAEVAELARADAQASAVTAAVISVPVDIAPARVKGISTSRSIDFEITDIHALVCHVAKNAELINLLTIDSVKLRAQVKATGLNTNLPGVRVFEKRSMSARSA